METISFTLKPLPPFSLEFTAWALRRRPENLVDRWDGTYYSRIFSIKGKTVKVSASQGGSPERPRLNVSISGEPAMVRAARAGIAETIKKMFSLSTDLTGFYELARRDKGLRALAEQFHGMKPPRFPTIFEALVNALACQQVSLALGITLLNRLSGAYGPPFVENDKVFHAFPAPEDLAGLSPEDFRGLSFSRSKGRAIIELSGAVMEGTFDAGKLEKMTDAWAVQYLTVIRGIGRWSAEYALLRALGRINVFPGDDVGAQKNLQEFMRLQERPDYEKIKEIASRWRPYAGLVYFHFLLHKLIRKGYLG